MAAPANIGLILWLLFSIKFLRDAIPSCCFLLLSFNLPISINPLLREPDSSLVTPSSSDKDFPESFRLLVQSQNSHSIVHWSRKRASFTSTILSKYSFRVGISIAIGYKPPSRQ